MRAWRRLVSSPTNILLLFTVVFGLYVLLYDQPASGDDLRLPQVDVEQIEREADVGKPVVEVSYDEMFNRSLKRDAANDARPPGDQSSNSYRRVWEKVDKAIRRSELFADGAFVDEVLHAMEQAKVVKVELLTKMADYESGTSEKWVATLEGGQKAMMKIVWEKKGDMKEDGLCNYGYEMPTSEIAAFHLHRILGFRNTPYVVGRKFNLRDDILPVASPAVAKQITIKKGNMTCVVGKCYFCKEATTLCPSDGYVEASLALWVTRKMKLYTLPPKYMPFSTPRMEEWEGIGFNNRTYCEKIKRIHPYEYNWFYLDLFDFAVLDTLMFHYDSKHYIIYDESAALGLTVRLDHGRAFCAHDRDEENIFLAPIKQCCTLRRSTYQKLEVFRHKGLLSARLNRALKTSLMSPVLADVWFSVIQRRLQLIFNVLQRCATANGWNRVLVSG